MDPESELGSVADQRVCTDLDPVYPKYEIRLERDIHHLMVELKALRRIRQQEARRKGHRPGFGRPEREGLA